jgi:hypothetical protein
MSSLQKFHRRTQSVGGGVVKVIGSEAPVAGSGFYLGMAGDGTSYMYQAPKSTEVRKAWGSNGIVRGTISTTNGISNTNTLVSFGTTAHPAAGECKYMTTGGYNTWYLPAKNELMTLYSNKNSNPTEAISGNYRYYSSTEYSGNYSYNLNVSNGTWTTSGGSYSKYWTHIHRAVRRALV